MPPHTGKSQKNQIALAGYILPISPCRCRYLSLRKPSLPPHCRHSQSQYCQGRRPSLLLPAATAARGMPAQSSAACHCASRPCHRIAEATSRHCHRVAVPTAALPTATAARGTAVALACRLPLRKPSLPPHCRGHKPSLPPHCRAYCRGRANALAYAGSGECRSRTSC